MIYINITKFVIISELEKDHSVIETHCLKNVIFSQSKACNSVSLKIVSGLF